MGRKAKDLTGQRFGRLTVIKITNERLCGSVCWYCKCDCGNTKVIATGNLQMGNTISCGCYKKEILSDLAVNRNGMGRIHHKPHSSMYKGVYYVKTSNKWRAIIEDNTTRYNLGHFDNEVDAALAYNEAALRLHKKPVLNVIGGD